MRVLKWLVGLVLALVVIVFGGGLLLPDAAHVERSITIQRPPAQVFGHLDSFARFQEWSPWGKDYDPTTVVTLSGPERGPGARMEWRGEKSSGAQEITAVTPQERVDIALDFGTEGKAKAAFLLSPEGDGGTRLTWSFDSSAEGSPIGRWFGLAMDSLLGPYYETGLTRLKALIETEPAAEPSNPIPAPEEEAPAAEPAADDPAQPAATSG